MEFLFIGLTVGLIMGLTGAGGALISIPLFLTLLNASLKEATVLSLIAVIFGTSTNLFGQKHSPDKKIVVLFVTFGAIANYSTIPLKALIADLAIAGMLLIIGLYSIWSIWKKKANSESKIKEAGFIKTASIGAGLGIVTTLTGLGGGVLLVPVLKNFFGMKYGEALPTSLLTILLISLISLLLQIEVGLNLLNGIELTQIGLGALGAYFFLKWLLKKLHHDRVELTRKIVFTAVTVYSVSSVIIKSL